MVKKLNYLWFDKRILVLLIAFYTQAVTSFWEYAICTNNNIVLYDNNWQQLNNSKHSIQQKGFNNMKALTYDAVHDVFFFANNLENSGIFKLKVFNETSFEISELVPGSKDNNLRDIVYDFQDDAIYWSDSKQAKIFRLSSKGKVETFLNVTSDVEGLEIDSCKRNLFFVSRYNEKMNVVSLDDDNRIVTELAVGNHDKPIAIAIDHQSRRLYVADVQQSVHYSIDSILTNGSDFRREIDSALKTPRSIAVDKEFVYYIEGDDHELRRYKKNFDLNLKQKSEVFKTFTTDPQDIIVRSNFMTDRDSKLCKVEVEVKKEAAVEVKEEVAVKAPEVSKKQESSENVCEINKCSNFCLNDGKCSIVKNEPKCSCKSKFSGDRCESDVCTNFCLNNGECIVYRNSKQPRCKCEEDFTGDRCEKLKTEARVPETADKHVAFKECSSINVTYIILAVCATISLVLFLVILVVAKKMKRPMRPRIKKTFKVRKNIEPLTYRPHTEQCEVIIEDCCNMNICETPCYDPKTLQKEINESSLSVKLTSSKKCSNKEDKQDLLKHMEFNQ